MSIVKVKILLAVSVGLAAAAFAEDERETFQKWHIGVGAAFNFGAEANLRSRNLPAPVAYRVPALSTKKAAEARAARREYDDGGYIYTDENDNGWATTNWKLTDTSYLGDGRFDLDNAYQEVAPGGVSHCHRDHSDDDWQFGVSAEISRELWIHDEKEENRWGVDFAAAFSYFFRRDLYASHGRIGRVDMVKDGVIRTKVDDPDAMFKYDSGECSVGADGMYGYGSWEHNPMAPALGLLPPFLNAPEDLGGPSHPVGSACRYNAGGDYRELEMLFMFRPWYEIKDWWRVFGEIGVGVSWGKFDSSFHGGGIAAEEDFAQWDCYGVAGLGTVFRYKSFDIMIDFLGRFWRDDFEVEGRYVDGYISRADWGLRLMIGYEF